MGDTARETYKVTFNTGREREIRPAYRAYTESKGIYTEREREVGVCTHTSHGIQEGRKEEDERSYARTKAYNERICMGENVAFVEKRGNTRVHEMEGADNQVLQGEIRREETTCVYAYTKERGVGRREK